MSKLMGKKNNQNFTLFFFSCLTGPYVYVWENITLVEKFLDSCEYICSQSFVKVIF